MCMSVRACVYVRVCAHATRICVCRIVEYQFDFNNLPYSSHSGLYLQDLTFINMVGDKLEDDKSCINFNKRWKQFNTVDKIRLAQTK